MRRVFWLCVGWIALILGGIGIFLPIMPTVPFLLIAVWAFSGVSEHLRNRIMRDPRFGPQVRAWVERGEISRVAKIWSVGAMAAGLIWSGALGVPALAFYAQAAICTAVAAYIVTRPHLTITRR